MDLCTLHIHAKRQGIHKLIHFLKVVFVLKLKFVSSDLKEWHMHVVKLLAWRAMLAIVTFNLWIVLFLFLAFSKLSLF